MDIDGFPRQFARTRRFTLGVPRDITVSPDGDRVLFLRSESGVDPRAHLWMYEGGQERILAGPTTAYATDRDVRVVAHLLDGSLWTVRTDGGGPPRRIPTAGPVRDPRPSPDGTLIAYVARGALRVVGTDGTGDRPLAVPESADITYGLPDHTAVESIGRTRGHWWSPDGDALLVARVDTSGVERRWLSDPSIPAGCPGRSRTRRPARSTRSPRCT